MKNIWIVLILVLFGGCLGGTEEKVNVTYESPLLKSGASLDYFDKTLEEDNGKVYRFKENPIKIYLDMELYLRT